MNNDILLILTDSFTSEESEYLWKSGVNLDDWDYAIICSPELMNEQEATEEVYDDNEKEWVTKPCIKYSPKRYILERLLTGCCSNTWRVIDFRGKKLAIGIAYHG